MAGNCQSAVAGVDIEQLHDADRAGPGGMDAYERDREAHLRCDCRGDAGSDLAGIERLENGLDDAQLDAIRGVAENDAVRFRQSEQQAKALDRVVSLAFMHVPDLLEHCVAGDFPEMLVAIRPREQNRLKVAKVEVDRGATPTETARRGLSDTPVSRQ